jgi:3-oxoacyl-[acyl-carrier protein] reductase
VRPPGEHSSCILSGYATVSPMLALQGKRCLITGGSRNLGRSLALAFANAGAKVAFTFSKNTEDAAETERLLRLAGAEPRVFQGSVTDSAHVTGTVQSLVREWGGVDVLVNNAGVTQIVPIALLDEADWDHVMDVNVKGAYLYSRAALRPMLKARSGHILNIGSFVTDRVLNGPAHYAASKAALKGLSQALAAEVGRYGISVNYLAPGLLNQGLAKRLPQHRVADYAQQTSLRRVGTIQEIAELAVWLVSAENTFMTGSAVIADGGL